MHKISVIIPCYNAADYIDRCLDSVVNQTYGLNRIRIICIDDASSDDTYGRLLKWEERYTDNFVIIRNEVNMRQGAARNLALKYADTEYITYVDADDFVDKNFIRIMMDVADNSKAEMVTCGHIRDYGRDDNLDCMKNVNVSYKERIISNRKARTISFNWKRRRKNKSKIYRA